MLGCLLRVNKNKGGVHSQTGGLNFALPRDEDQRALGD